MGQAIFLHLVAKPFGTRALQGVWQGREAEGVIGFQLEGTCYMSEINHLALFSLQRGLGSVNTRVLPRWKRKRRCC